MVNVKRAPLPLGVDIGRSRVRIALLERDRAERPKLAAVAARDYAEDPSAALIEALAELGTRERRCVLALSRPDALLCLLDLPTMTHRERVRAARYEAAHLVDYPIAEGTVSLVRTTTQQRWALGVVRRDALAAALGTARKARLRPLAVDDAAFALRRAHPDAGCIIDVGHVATHITLPGVLLPHVMHIPIGGNHLTDAIAQSLGVDVATAERRKRAIGFGGAGGEARDALVAACSGALAAALHAGHAVVTDIVLCGNGSRIPGIDEAVERATNTPVRLAMLEPGISETLPADVLRSAAADWSLAYGLGLWSTAG
jgi:Tfp pilus assembly PilM family ATPase